MTSQFPEIKKNFGFGYMRLPMVGEDVDIPQTKRMVDAYFAAGFQYIDTAHPYIQGKSELAVKECISSRYPRERFLLANKLTAGMYETEGEIRPFFEEQLRCCGVDYFDFYLLHANSAKRHEFYTRTRSYELLRELKAEGKVRHIGFSFHDTAAVLDEILTAHPEMEFVQLQFNYVDYEDPKVESRKCYEVCRRHGKAVFVMEPVRGGSLVNLPREAVDLMGGRPASYAIRYCAGFEGVDMVLSGMSTLEQMEDNLATMGDFKPLDSQEMAIVDRVRTMYQAQNRIPCTACRYCTDGCPAGIDIPGLFAWANEKRAAGENLRDTYGSFLPNGGACLSCGACEKACPQHLRVPELLARLHAQLSGE